jgi:hypothetical protein
MATSSTCLTVVGAMGFIAGALPMGLLKVGWSFWLSFLGGSFVLTREVGVAVHVVG